MDDDIRRCCHPTKALNLEALARVEQDSRIISTFGATVIDQPFSFSLHVHALKLCGVRDCGTAVRRMLTVAITEKLALQCNWLGTGGK